MTIIVNRKQISTDEEAQITQDVHADLIDYLYQGCLPGTLTGLVISLLFYFDFHGYTSTYLLVGWLIFFDCMMIALSTLYFLYLKYKQRFSMYFWEKAYSTTMCGCAIAWMPTIYLIPSDLTRQYLALMLLFLATAGYAIGSIGQLKLCVTTLSLLLAPVVVWSFYLGGIFYNIIGVYSIIYFCFLLSINYRSTQWLSDSLKLKIENSLVSYQVNHDVLTNLPNQRLLPQYIESASELVKKTDTIFALVCFSLNRTEIINDSYGHIAGDALVRSVANRLTDLSLQMANKNIQYIITISRKDTFNILITPLTLQDIEEKVKILFSILEEPFYIEKKELRMTASVGVSIFPQDGEDAKTLWAHADAAMLSAKKFGGNRLEFYKTEITAKSPVKLSLESELYLAVKNRKLQLHYQPLIDVKTNQICGMEALLRWPSANGYISPIQFIPIAEENGLIIPLGEWVLQEACTQQRKWQELGYTNLKVAVNLSEKQLQQENFLDILNRIIHKTKIYPKFLELELTETFILDEEVIGLVQEFKKIGLSIAIDDFGTGYSGLSYLKRFQIDKLKIDQSFIKDIPFNNESITIVSAIIAMAKEMNVKTLAEGVETEDQLNFLKNKGCDYIQGYYYSRPLDPNAFTNYLKQFYYEI